MICDKEKELHVTGDLNNRRDLYPDLTMSDLISKTGTHKIKGSIHRKTSGPSFRRHICVVMVTDMLYSQ